MKIWPSSKHHCVLMKRFLNIIVIHIPHRKIGGIFVFVFESVFVFVLTKRLCLVSCVLMKIFLNIIVIHIPHQKIGSILILIVIYQPGLVFSSVYLLKIRMMVTMTTIMTMMTMMTMMTIMTMMTLMGMMMMMTIVIYQPGLWSSQSPTLDIIHLINLPLCVFRDRFICIIVITLSSNCHHCLFGEMFL